MHKNIKSLLKEARIKKDTTLKNIYAPLLANLDNIAKEKHIEYLDNSDVIKRINYWVKQMEKLIEIYSKSSQEIKLKEAQEERLVYLNLLPAQLTDEESIYIIEKNKITNVPVLMQFFSKHYLGRYDSKNIIKLLSTCKGT